MEQPILISIKFFVEIMGQALLMIHDSGNTNSSGQAALRLSLAIPVKRITWI
jgi:hypothetical protein